jgi:hypothetical protein
MESGKDASQGGSQGYLRLSAGKSPLSARNGRRERAEGGPSAEETGGEIQRLAVAVGA